MKKIANNKGLRGRRIKIQPEKVDTLLQADNDALIQKGKVIAAGPLSSCKKGDTVIFNAWGLDKVTLNDESFYYLLDTDEFVLEVI